MPYGALIAGAANIFGGLMSRRGQQDTNKMNIALARENRAFQERMSSTAHQREIKDLKAAGLNPILSGMGGMGASSPSGSLAQVQNPEAELGEGIKEGVSSAMHARRLKADLKNVDAQTEQATQAGYRLQTLSALDNKQTALTLLKTNGQEIQNRVYQEQLQQMKNINSAGNLDRAINESKAGTAIRVIERLSGSALQLATGVGALRYRGKKPNTGTTTRTRDSRGRSSISETRPNQ